MLISFTTSKTSFKIIVLHIIVYLSIGTVEITFPIHIYIHTHMCIHEYIYIYIYTCMP